jgi:predicted nucleotidyltransferase
MKETVASVSDGLAGSEVQISNIAIHARMGLDGDCLAEYCRRWKIKELLIFGSVLRANYTPNSDIDMLVSFFDDASWGLFEHLIMEEELSAMLGRKVDLVTRRAVERSSNWIRRQAILAEVQPYYVAR